MEYVHKMEILEIYVEFFLKLLEKYVENFWKTSFGNVHKKGCTCKLKLFEVDDKDKLCSKIKNLKKGMMKIKTNSVQKCSLKTWKGNDEDNDNIDA